MRTIEWNLETSQQGADWSGEIEVEDAATDDEIDDLVREEVFNIISWGWTEKKPEPTDQSASGLLPKNGEG